MLRVSLKWCQAVVLFGSFTGCVPSEDLLSAAQQADTVLLVGNRSRDWYLLVEVGTPEHAYKRLPLLPPTGVIREPFRDLFGGACPNTMTLRAYLYEHDEAGGFAPLASGQLDVQPCDQSAVFPVFDVYLRDTARGEGTLLLLQDTSQALRFDFHGLNVPAPDDLPETLDPEETVGYVLDLQGNGVPDIGVVVWTLYRGAGPSCLEAGDASEAGFLVTTCGDADKEAVACCQYSCAVNQDGWPAAVTATDADGRFEVQLSPGVYVAEVFADGKLFRPTRIMFEAPIENVVFLAQDDDGRELELSDSEALEEAVRCGAGAY